MSFGDASQRPWLIGEAQSSDYFAKALELGINFFDTADYYGNGLSETILGRAIKAMVPRHEVVLATKVFAPTSQDANGRGLSRKHIFDAIDASLGRLQTDYVDLYQIHRWDYDTPIEETLEALHDVVKSGKARYLGASSMWAWQFMKSLAIQNIQGWSKFISMQNHYNLLYREEEREMIPLCLDSGIGMIPWSPLARGFLAGKVKASEETSARSESDELAHEFYGTEQDHLILARVRAVAKQRGCSPATVALAWLAGRPGVAAPILGVTKLEQLESAAVAVVTKLTPEEIAQLEEPYKPRPVVGLMPVAYARQAGGR